MTAAMSRANYVRLFWMTLATIGIVVVSVGLALPTAKRPPVDSARDAARKVDPVQVTDRGTISISKSSPISNKLEVVAVRKESVSFPLLTVSGSILARVRSGKDVLQERWQFSTPDLASNYADLLKTNHEIEFSKSQMSKTRELADAEVARCEAIVDRLKSLSESGTVPQKDLAAAKADLLRAQLQGQKDLFAAESALRLATTSHSSLERKLSQAGVEPPVLARAAENMVLVIAHVPESRVSLVHEGQGCTARFYGYPDRPFPAHVEWIGSTVTSDRRTLRVLFDVTDADNVLRPGMFAEVGLGTDKRDALLIPTTSLIHIGRADYVLLEKTPEEWTVAKVVVGEPHGDVSEVLSGLKAGDRIIAAGAILLKPLVVKSLMD